MKVIIPVAGSGTRLQPHTFSAPKPLLRVAGKTILDYVLAPLEAVQVDEIVFVVASMGDRIKEHVAKNYTGLCCESGDSGVGQRSGSDNPG